MLLYYLFWMLMGLFIHLYILFRTNLLTQGPVQIAGFFAYFSVSQKRNIKRSPNGMKPSERDFQNKRDPEDLEWTSRNEQGGHKAGGAPTPLGVPSTLVGPSLLHRRTSSSYIYLRTPKPSYTEPKPYFHCRNLLYP